MEPPIYIGLYKGYMSCSLNSLTGGFYRGSCRGVLQGLLEGMLGV